MRCLLRLALLPLTPALSAQIPQRPAITGIAFVRFAVSDAAAAKHFYADQLGYAARPQEDGSMRYVVRGDGMQFIETASGGPQELAAGPDRLLAVGLHTTNVKQMQAYLAAKHVASTLANGLLTLHDPEGNTLFFLERLRTHTPPMADHTISHRIIHAGFVVQSQTKEDAFYRDILGFRPLWHGGMKDGVTDWYSVQVPEGTDWIEYMLNVKPDASAASRGVMNHVSLGVEHMDTVVAQLKENGCTTAECTSPKMGRDGKVQLNLYDPDHTRVEVMEFAPSGPVCCSTYGGPLPKASDPE